MCHFYILTTFYGLDKQPGSEKLLLRIFVSESQLHGGGTCKYSSYGMKIILKYNLLPESMKERPHFNANSLSFPDRIYYDIASNQM